MKFRRLSAFVTAFVLFLACIPAAVSDQTARLIIPESITVDKDGKAAIEVRFDPPEYSEAVTWESDNEKIARVTKKGKVKGLKAGECIITATTPSGLTARCRVTVVRPVKSVTLSASAAEISIGKTCQLTASVKPKKAYDKTIVWTSSNESVATVDENGLVTAIAKGKCVITAAARNGKKAVCTVTVKKLKPTSIKLSSLFITVETGSEKALGAKVKPKNASNTGITYTSSDESIAVVDENGVVKGVAAGRAVITLAADGSKKLKEKVQVCVVEPGSGRMAGLVIGLNPGHQTTTITKLYPIAPGSKEKAYGCKVGAAGPWTRVPEYETNLQISLMLRDMLEAEGATVVMTRTENDVSIHNIKRAKLLNKAGVDVALQVHCNSWTNPAKHGLSVYRKTTGDWQAQELAIARLLTEHMAETTGALNLGVKTNNRYMSLNWSTTPAVLLEVGYLSNKREDKLLATDAYRMKVAEGIYEGLAEYFGR